MSNPNPNTTTATTKSWNANGCVLCDKHAPINGGSLWHLEGWETVPADLADEMPCERCGA